MWQDPDERVAGYERKASKVLMGVAVGVEGTGAGWEEETDGFTRADNEQAGVAAQ